MEVTPGCEAACSEALLAWDAVALERIEEVVASPPHEPGSGGAIVGAERARVRSGFAFALRALAAVAPYASQGVVEALIRWHDRERARAASAQRGEDERSVRECAVNCVFCEALLATLAAHPMRGAARGAILLDALQERALEFFLLPSAGRKPVSYTHLTLPTICSV